MIIPSVKIVWISEFKGYGLVANQRIPKGTITFVQDGLDIVIPSSQLESVDPLLREQVEKYSFEDFSGNRIISWDLGKYMNHDDNANTLSSGYGFEVAIRDIEVGEEVTDDYRIFSTHHDTRFDVNHVPGALQVHQPWPDELIAQWDQKLMGSLSVIDIVDQPLKNFLTKETWSDIRKFHKNKKYYRSVREAMPFAYKINFESLTV